MHIVLPVVRSTRIARIHENSAHRDTNGFARLGECRFVVVMSSSPRKAGFQYGHHERKAPALERTDQATGQPHLVWKEGRIGIHWVTS